MFNVNMISRIAAEFIGTFFLVAVILASKGDPVHVGVGLVAALFISGKISGGHLNPAVSTAMLANGWLDWASYLAYIVAQVLGALAALGVNLALVSYA